MIVEKPWGREIIWALTEKYVGKILEINAGHALSMQFHHVKDETIMVISGKMELLIDNEIVVLNEGDAKRIAPGVVHRMTALTDCRIAEVSTPELNDIVRLEDRYGRVNT